VIPFITSQIERIIISLQHWKPYHGCALNQQNTILSNAKVTLIFYFDENLNIAPKLKNGQSIQEYFLQYWKQMPIEITG
jgi:hypothetical protein